MNHEVPSGQMPILLLDGGLGTTLGAEPYNITYNERTPLWSSHLLLSDPNTLVSVHQDFVAAGADIILTATYQASHEGFAKTPRLDPKSTTGYDQDEAAAYMCKAVDLVERAIRSYSGTRHPASIALSLGAYGAILSPSQEFSGVYPPDMTSEDALASWHAERLDIFRSNKATWAKIDYVALETVQPLAEIRGIRKAANAIAKPWWISHVVPDEVQVSDLPAVVSAMLSPEENLAVPWGIGCNCTAVEKIGDVEQAYRDIIEEKFSSLIGKIWLVLYPDGTQGEVYDSKSMAWVKTSKHGLNRPWQDLVMEVVTTAQASQVWKGIIVGGCCKTSPEIIKELRVQIDISNKPSRAPVCSSS